MRFTPRYYQKDGVNALFEYTARNHGKHPLVVIPTGGGKSLMIADVIEKVFHAPATRILMLTHQKHLIKQNYNEFISNTDLSLPDAGIYSAGLKSRETTNRIIFAGIQSVHSKAYQLGAFDIIIVDEAHRIPHKAMGTYRKFLDDSFKINPKIVICGFTATPYRLKGGLLTEGEDSIFDDICYEASVAELIDPEHPKNKDKIQYLSNLISKPVNHDSEIDTSKIKIQGGEFVLSDMQKAFDISEKVQSAVKEIVFYTEKRKKTLIFASGIEHGDHIEAELQKYGKKVGFVHSQKESKVNDQILEDFHNGLLNYVVNIGVLTTGYNEKGIDCIVLLHSTMSPGLYVQECVDMDTEILTERGFLNFNDIKKTDICFAFDMESNSIKKTDILDIFKTKKNINDLVYEYESHHLNFRVTSNHDMIVKNRHGKSWFKKTIEDTKKYKDSFHIPVSSFFKSNEKCNLRDCDIEFLGWFLSDGIIHRTTKAISISQSLTNINYVNEIEKCIIETGMKYSKREVIRKDKFQCYNNNIVFIISYGVPRLKDKDKTGWSYLAEYIDKNINKNYDRMDKRQISILLSSINKGDGCKHKNISWKQHTMTICMGGNKLYTDNLQSLLIRKGFRCNLSLYQPKPSTWALNPKLQYKLRIKDIQTSSIAGVNCSDGIIKYSKNPYKRSRIISKQLNKEEWFWCIRNNFGTIISRRNGKVSIMGNCGRGFRLYPDKKDCLILDFGHNIERFGSLDKIEVRKNRVTGKTEVTTCPQKVCPKCEEFVHILTKVCPCGYVFPMNEEPRHDETASTADIISVKQPPLEIIVKRVEYGYHIKKDKPPTLRVDYYPDVHLFEKYSEWICLDHTGYAKIKAFAWVQRRTSLRIESVDEAYNNKEAFLKPTRILVDLNDKFPKIIGYDFNPVEEEIIEENEIPENEEVTDDVLAKLIF